MDASRARRRGPRMGLGLALLAAACSQGEPDAPAPSSALRLGYFANVTHAPALIALDLSLIHI